MKNIILIAIILLGFACKKKTVTLTEPVTPTCITSIDQFSGTYTSPNNDTIVIVFLHNNCPKDNFNTYLVKGLGQVAQTMLKSGETFELKDYEVIADEKMGKAVNGNNFSLGRQSNGYLIFSSYKVNNGCEFVKI